MTTESDINAVDIFNSLDEIHEHYWCKYKTQMAALVDLVSRKLLTVYTIIICI